MDSPTVSPGGTGNTPPVSPPQGQNGGQGPAMGRQNGGGGGGPGCVRIIWGVAADGSTRCFPYNYASENPNMKVAGMT